MRGMMDWSRFPSRWIEDNGLRAFRWERDGGGSDNTAALLVLAVIVHRADRETGRAEVTYADLVSAIGISKTKIANGLEVLQRRGLIERRAGGQSMFLLTDFDPLQGWAMLPAKTLYRAGRIPAFEDFKLRSATELNAMKLYFLFAARRDRRSNVAMISFDRIMDYTGIERHRIKAATSLLATTQLAYVERVPTQHNEHGVANAYRLVGLEPRRHMGTIGRSMGAVEFDALGFVASKT